VRAPSAMDAGVHGTLPALYYDREGAIWLIPNSASPNRVMPPLHARRVLVVHDAARHPRARRPAILAQRGAGRHAPGVSGARRAAPLGAIVRDHRGGSSFL